MKVGRTLRRTEYGYLHWCPGCNEIHHIQVDEPQSNGAQWEFNGDVDRPTFTPSVRIRIPGAGKSAVACCHYFITEGAIRFCPDSTHPLAGKTVPLPDLPEDM